MNVIIDENQDILIVEDGTERWIKPNLVFRFVPHTVEELKSILEIMQVHIKEFSDNTHWVSVYEKLRDAEEPVQEE